MEGRSPVITALFLLSLLPRLNSIRSGAGFHPLILIPGQNSNQIDARLDGAYKPPNSPLCSEGNGGWFKLWLNESSLDGPSLRCFADQMTLLYDPVLDDYRNAAGVETHVPFFGSTLGFINGTRDPSASIPTWMPLVQQLLEIGYEEGVNLFGAPYDFRYGLAAPGHPSRVGSQYLHNLKRLIEKASRLNNDKPAIVLTHSLGGLFALQLLSRNLPSWSQRFIKHLVTLAAPWAGTVVEMRILASGNTLGFPYVYDPLVLRPETRSLETNLWLLPSPTTFGDKPLVVSRQGNYSASEMGKFLKGIGFEEGARPYETRVRPLVEHLGAPGVPVTCMVGSGVATHEMLVYDGENGFDDQPRVVYGEGDGLVNLESLLALEKKWGKVPGQVVEVVMFANMSHVGLLSEEVALEHIVKVILEVNSFTLRSNA